MNGCSAATDAAEHRRCCTPCETSAAFIFMADPAPCTTARFCEAFTPMKTAKPSMPSLPTRPTSSVARSLTPASREITPSIWKIDVTNQDFGPVENLLKYQRDFFQLRLQTPDTLFWAERQGAYLLSVDFLAGDIRNSMKSGKRHKEQFQKRIPC